MTGRRRRTHASLFDALAAVQAEAPEVLKQSVAETHDERGPRTFSYADLHEVTEVAIPVLTRHGLAFAVRPTMAGDRFVLRYELRHEASSEVQKGQYPLPDPRSSPQALGAAITSARRYLLQTLAGIAPRADENEPAPAPPVPAAGREDRLDQYWITFMKTAIDRDRLEIGKEGARSMDAFSDKVQAAYLARAGVLSRANSSNPTLASSDVETVASSSTTKAEAD